MATPNLFNSSGNRTTLNVEEMKNFMNKMYPQVVPQNLRNVNGSTNMKNALIRRTILSLQSRTRGSKNQFINLRNNPTQYVTDLFQTLAKNMKKRFFVAGTNRRTVCNKNKVEKAQKHPWFIIKYPKTPTSGPFYMFPQQLQFHEIDVPGLASPLSEPDPVSWKIGWNRTDNGTTYGYLRINRNTNNNSVLQELVGKFCNSETFKSKPQHAWCQRSATLKYSENNTGRGYQTQITKSGLSGLGVSALARRLKLSPTGGKRRRYYLDIKRTGDYGQIFSCKYLYDDSADPDYYKAILNPGNEFFANQYLTKPLTEENLQALTNLEQNGSFYFMYATFCTQDRPAAKFAMLMRIPFIFEKPSDNKLYFGILNNHTDLRVLGYTPGPTDIINFTDLTGRHIMDIVNYNYIEIDGGRIPAKGVYPVWYQLMCIIDTAHDFTLKRVGSWTIVNNIIRLIRGLYDNNNIDVPTPYRYAIKIQTLIDYIFSGSIGDIETEASNDISKFVLAASRISTIPDIGEKFQASFGVYLPSGAATNNLNKNVKLKNKNGTPITITLDGLLARFNSCIVLDSTQKKLPPVLTKRISLLAAKYTDPGS